MTGQSFPKILKTINDLIKLVRYSFETNEVKVSKSLFPNR